MDGLPRTRGRGGGVIEVSVPWGGGIFGKVSPGSVRPSDLPLPVAAGKLELQTQPEEILSVEVVHGVVGVTLEKTFN